MKIAIINDTHFGIRGDSQIFFLYFMKFFDEVFFPYLKNNNIKTIIHAGDLMDRRKFVNFNILNQVRDRFLSHLYDERIKMHCILGNHDVYYRNTNRVNSLQELFHNDMTIYNEPRVVNFDGMNIALLPWINNENYDESIQFIKTANAPILIGHLELDGYEVLRGINYHGGMSSKIFERYEQVFSGHFHYKQTSGNINYLGTQYQMTYSDLDEQKGFHILDTSTRELKYIENPYKIFHIIKYNDKEKPYKSNELNFSYLENCYVKLYVECKKHPNSFDRFVDKIYTSNAADVTIIENYEDIESNETDLIDLEQDTIMLINNEIDSIEEIHNKDKMKKIIKDLHTESFSL